MIGKMRNSFLRAKNKLCKIILYARMSVQKRRRKDSYHQISKGKQRTTHFFFEKKSSVPDSRAGFFGSRGCRQSLPRTSSIPGKKTRKEIDLFLKIVCKILS